MVPGVVTVIKGSACEGMLVIGGDIKRGELRVVQKER